MRGRNPTRRRVLHAGSLTATTVLAGCTLPRSNPSNPESKRFLEFEEVDERFRERTESVYERVVELADAELAASTTVRLIDRTEMRELASPTGLFGETTTQRLAHRALGLIEDLDASVPFEFSGAYFSGSREVIFVATDAETVDDQLIAHELLHAVQFQEGGASEWDHGWSTGFDRHKAQRSLVEGTAQFLEDEYVGGCDGEFSDCRLRNAAAANAAGWDEEWLLAFGPYVNGHDFAAALADRGGWEAVWDAHEAPPTHTGQVLKPEWYPDREPADVAVEDESNEEWELLDRERLGMQSAFATLWHARALPYEEVYADEDTDEDEVFTGLVRYRSAETDAWRGDEFVAHEREDGRYGWQWTLRWADSAAAEDAYELFRVWADERGEATDDDGVWERETGTEALALDGEELLVGSAPETDALETLSPALGE
ncbi:hypothetical protein [Halovivax sp.]|uniref:hypothetical protein n=1 Tax=Halovivax sp. TaxID=1935978 RepID=UPI0025C7207E|nr:hypothetical protein [Halovivax sp.]